MGVLAKDPNPPARKRRHAVTCNTGVVLAELDDDDRAALAGWLADRDNIGARDIAEKLAEHDITLGIASIVRHRRGECRCSTDG